MEPNMQSGGQAAGRITSTASFSNRNLSGSFALGFVREEMLERKEGIDYEGGTAVPLSVPPSLRNQTANVPKVPVGESNA